MSCLSNVLINLVVLILTVQSAPTYFKTLRPTEILAVDYLSKYGYLEEDTKTVKSVQDLGSAITAFQELSGLDPTGTLDEETLKQMSLPRCGNKDRSRRSDLSKEVRNFKLSPSKWLKKDLTYVISEYPASGPSRQQVDQEIARAFQVWSDHTNLTFRVANLYNDDRADINIKFVTFDHGDGSPFDGPGGTLGHAFFPTSGAAHFDDSEKWTVSGHDGINLFQVAAHEFGHSLGLEHSKVRSALMAAFYPGYLSTFKLHNDDIQGIQKLYGQKPDPKLTPTYKSLPVDNLCKDMTFDTIFTDLQDFTYVIKGSKYWELGSDFEARILNTTWPGLPGKIDAAFSHREMNKTYFFSGAYFWRYQENRLDKGYPMLISERFRDIPDNLDAAFVSPRNGQIYFFKGRNFWKFDYTILPGVSYEYPVPICNFWLEAPDTIDATFTTRGVTYFAKSGSYARIFSRTTDESTRYRSMGYLLGCTKFDSKDYDTTGQCNKPSIHSESLGKPNHWGCIRHPECRMFP